MKRRKYPDDPWFFCTSEGAEISHLLQIADMPLSKKLDMLSNLADTVEIITHARERRLAKEATLKIAEQPEWQRPAGLAGPTDRSNMSHVTRHTSLSS